MDFVPAVDNLKTIGIYSISQIDDMTSLTDPKPFIKQEKIDALGHIVIELYKPIIWIHITSKK